MPYYTTIIGSCIGTDCNIDAYVLIDGWSFRSVMARKGAYSV